VLLLMTGWLLYKARSSTAVTCMLIGSAVLVAMKVSAFRNQVKWFGSYVVGVAVAIALLHMSGVWGALVSQFAEAAGRDPTLHGRAEIWEAVLKEDFNPLFGTGFYSFWSEERNRRLSETYYYHLGEAHNGYIETYLNSGFIGLILFAAMIIHASRGIKREVLNGSGLGALRLAFIIPIGLYGLSESIFDRLVHVWFALVLVMMEFPRLRKPGLVRTTGHAGGDVAGFAVPDPDFAHAPSAEGRPDAGVNIFRLWKQIFASEPPRIIPTAGTSVQDLCTFAHDILSTGLSVPKDTNERQESEAWQDSCGGVRQ